MRRASASTGRKTRAPRTRSRPRSPTVDGCDGERHLPSNLPADTTHRTRVRRVVARRAATCAAPSRAITLLLEKTMASGRALAGRAPPAALASNPTDSHCARRQRSRSAAGFAGGHARGLAKTSRTRGRSQPPATSPQSWRRGGLHQPSSLPRSQRASEAYSTASTRAERQGAVAAQRDNFAGRVRAPPSTESLLPSRPLLLPLPRLPNVRAFSCESRA
jgi:hypothetical protein